jgi:iron complex outermembrane receptor protein
MFAGTGQARAEAPQDDREHPRQLKQLSLEQLGNIEVTTVSKEPVKLIRTPAAVYVLTQEDIRRSGVTSIPEALRLVPGVDVARIDSDKWAIGVRGFEARFSRGLLVLIDGRTVYTPLFHGVYWESKDVLLEDVERIEVIRGPGGTIWGPNAVNGIINIITKNSRDTHGTLATASGGSLDQGIGAVRYGGGNGTSFDYRIYGKAFTRGPMFHSDQGQFDDWRMQQTGFRADWSLPGRDIFTLQGDIYSADAGQRVTVASYSSPFSTRVQQNAELSGGNLLGHWRRVVDEGSDFQLQLYYDRTNRDEVNFEESRDTFDADFLDHLTLPGNQNFLWGAGVLLSSGNVTPTSPLVVFTPNHRTDKLYDAFAQDEVPLISNRLALTVGAKFLHNIYTGFEIQPSVRLLWTPGPRQTIWAAVTRAVRTPSRIDEDRQLTALRNVNPLTFRRSIGDGKFVSEDLLGYEAGYRSLFTPTFYLDIAAFYNSYDHLLSSEPGTPFTETSSPSSPPHLVDPFFVRNGLQGPTYGIEIAPKWDLTHWWSLKGSYSYLRMSIKTSAQSLDSSTSLMNNGSSPRHDLVVQSSFDLPKRFEFDPTVHYVSALPAQGVSAYVTADARVGWTPNRHLELSFVGQNLLQPHHAEFGGDPGGLVGIKRSAYGKITWRSTAR